MLPEDWTEGRREKMERKVGDGDTSLTLKETNFWNGNVRVVRTLVLRFKGSPFEFPGHYCLTTSRDVNSLKSGEETYTTRGMDPTEKNEKFNPLWISRYSVLSWVWRFYFERD